MLIPTPKNFPADCGPPPPRGARAEPEQARPRFSHVLEQALTPPFAPWPNPPADIKTPVAAPPSQTTQPGGRNRRHGERRDRG